MEKGAAERKDSLARLRNKGGNGEGLIGLGRALTRQVQKDAVISSC